MLDTAVLRRLEGVLGRENVITSELPLRKAATATFPAGSTIPAILFPQSREQVQDCLRIASEYRVPVYPISTGKNWGYGSSVPVTDGCVLLDLSRMNRILDFNEDLAYVTVEPGVTQQQLLEELRRRRSKLWIDVTGASPQCSLIGNAMERGFGHTPQGDHVANICGFEVVLANGETIQTGFARFPDSHSAPIYRMGLGPSLDGLFTQSNLGVVTRMTIWLMPAPEYFQAFFFRSDREDGLLAIINALRPLRLNGTLRSAVHIGNDYKVLSGLQQYPWATTGGVTPLRPELIRSLRKEMKFGAWNGSGGLYGTRAQVGEARRLLTEALDGRANKLQFLDTSRFSMAARLAGSFRALGGWDLSRTLDLVRPLFGLLQGVPTDRSLASAYWRKKTAPPADMDPDRDACGLIWCSRVAPLEGFHAVVLAETSRRILLKHSFEPLLSITLNTERSIICVIALTYDREVEGEDDRARECIIELEAELSAKGYPPYRLGIQSMDQMQCKGAYAGLLSAIKEFVDPAGILSPGRYSADKGA